MKVNRLLLKLNEKTTLDDVVDFSNYERDPNHVRAISNCKVNVVATEFGSILSCELKITADVIASCAYTLEDVPYKVNIKENLTFTSEEELEDDDVFLEKENEIVLDNYVLSLILVNVPHNLHKKGAKLPQNGSYYRVMSEEDYLKEKAEKKKESPFDCLDKLDL